MAPKSNRPAASGQSTSGARYKEYPELPASIAAVVPVRSRPRAGLPCPCIASSAGRTPRANPRALSSLDACALTFLYLHPTVYCSPAAVAFSTTFPPSNFHAHPIRHSTPVSKCTATFLNVQLQLYTRFTEDPPPGEGLGLDPGATDATWYMNRPTQPYQSAAQQHQSQQARSIDQEQQQQPYPVQSELNAQHSYLNNGQHLQHQPQGIPPTDTTYYASHPSPRSTHSASGVFYPQDKADPMAATAHMQRPYPPPLYHTPQSNSPASVASPQSHDHSRPMYAQQSPQLTQPMYGYPQYQTLSQVHQPQYATHPSQSQHPHQIAPQPMMSYQGPPQMQHPQSSPHPSTIASSPRMKIETSQHHQQQPPQMRTPVLPQHNVPSLPPSNNSNPQPIQTQTPTSNANAAPGPIPATTPLVVRQDGNGVQWIAFEYSRDRVKMEYTIRCDVESVKTDSLSQEFKTENCVYPRATVTKEQYKGNRLAYETECNTVGWALAELNPCLRSKRGLIQRAVDSWRNSNQDPRLRSRRVRRQAKLNNRNKMASQHPPTPGSAVAPPTGLPGPNNSMAAPGARGPGSMPSASQQMHHHHANPDGSAPGHENVGADSNYSNASQLHRQNSINQHMTSPSDIRQSHVFAGYQSYPHVPTSLGPSMAPSMQPGMHQLSRPGGHAAMASGERDEKEEADAALFGDVPEGKRRKFILVDDTQRNCRVRVKVQLDTVEMSEIPDSFRKQNSVHPRSYFPVQMQTNAEPSRGDRFVEDENEEEDDGLPTVGRTSVPVQTDDGEGEFDVPKLSRTKKGKEQKLNELGYRMAWSQGRVFAGRTIFLQRALDAYRNKQRSSLLAAGQEANVIPAHLETRPGKRRWLERKSGGAIHTATPPVAKAE